MIKSGLVSIIMPLYKEQLTWVQKSVYSLINQNYHNIEIIIVNDDVKNSRNAMWIKSLKNPKITFIQNDHNLGIVGSLNKGLTYATGEYIARMDADDISRKDRISKQLEYLKGNLEVEFVMSGVSFIDEIDTELFCEPEQRLNFQDVKKKAAFKSVGHHSTWFMHRKVMETLLGYREVKYVEDLDFILRAINKDICIHVMPEILVYYRVQKHSLTQKNQLAMYRSAVAVRRAHKKGDINDSDPKNLSKRSLRVKASQEENFCEFVSSRKMALESVKQKKRILPVAKYLLVSLKSIDTIGWFLRDAQYGVLKSLKMVK